VAAFSIVATLALGIGANTAMFTLLNFALVRPAPIDRPERVLWIGPTDERGRVNSASFVEYRRIAAKRDVFAGVVAFTGARASIGADRDLSGRDADLIRSLVVSDNYFDVLGVRLQAGRGFRAEDATAAQPAVVLGDRLWRQRYSANRAVIN